MYRNLRFYIILFSLFSSIPVFAQIGRPGGLGGGGGSQGSTPQEEFVPTSDTLDFSYFYSDNPGREYSYRDTSLDAGIWQYDPIRQQAYDYAHLGNLGSAHQPIVYQPSYRRGFDLGFHQFDLYKLRLEDLPFYRLKDAFTNAYFSQGPLQTDAYFKAQFSRNFGKTLNYTLDYKRLNNGGAYTHQRATNTAFGTGFWYKGPKGRYNSFVSYRTNAIVQEDNGGIRPELITATNGADEFSIPVFLSTANTQHDQRAVAYTHYFKINGGRKKGNLTPPVITPPILPDSLFKDSLLVLPDSLSQSLSDSTKLTTDTSALQVLKDSSSLLLRDSLGQPLSGPRPGPKSEDLIEEEGKRSYMLAHMIQFERGVFKFYDEMPASDSVYYGDLQVDQRGLRNYLEHRTLENVFKLSTSSRRDGKTKQQKTGSQRDLLEVGLHHILHKINQEPRDSSLNNLFLTGKWNFTPSDRLLVQTEAHYGLWDNRGDYRLSGQLFFDLDKAGSLEIKGLSQRAEPNLLQNRLYISQREIWNNKFDKQFDTSISASYYQPISKTRISGQAHLISNYIYFDSLASPKQDDGTIRVLQLMIDQRFKLGPMYADTWFMLQDISGDKLRLPSFYFKQNLYFKGKLFKGVLDTNIGFNLRLSNAYFANNYQPLTGQFHLQDQQEIGIYPAVDVFIAFKVKFFRGFFRMENLTAFLTDDFFYQVANSPYPFAAIRFGINWQFLN